MKRAGFLLIRLSVAIMFIYTAAACTAESMKDSPAGSTNSADAEDGMYLPDPFDDENDGDSYEAVGTNPFVLAATDPFSTFAADVDTASYDIFRRDVNLGMLPNADSVRLEEYVNAFTYAYPAPLISDPHPFSVSVAGGDSIDGSRSVLRIGIQAMKPTQFEKKPTNVVFLIDTSGSMSSADKLPLVQHVLTKTVEILEPGDTVSIVTYAGEERLALSPTDVADADTIVNVINDLQSAGSTAGAAGIDLAYAQAEAAFVEDGINHVILCTDGDFNVGTYSTDELVSLIEEKRESGITLTVLGFGIGNLNDAMMEAVSNAGNGVYGVISSTVQADDYVENRMLSSLQLIAEDLKIQVEFNPAYVKAYRLLGYENRALADEDFVDNTVDAGEVGAGHRVTALYEIVRPDGTIPEVDGAPAVVEGEAVEGERMVSSSQLALVKVRYKDVDAGTADEGYELLVGAGATILDNRLNSADSDLQFAVAVAAFAEILKGSPYADSNNLAAIEQIITQTAGIAADRLEFAELFAAARDLLE